MRKSLVLHALQTVVASLTCGISSAVNTGADPFSEQHDGHRSLGDGATYDTCDENSVPANKASPRSLTPNTMHKICPGTLPDDTELGQPICGDGSAFSFYYTSPAQKYANNEKIVIEFLGGGACWDGNSCQNRQDMLAFPEDLDSFIGYSCSEASYGMDNYNGYPVSMMCDTTIDDVNFKSYHSILVPYCTQDVYMGDSATNYGNDDDGSIVYHHGAHNMMGVFRWIFKNFKNPSNIVLTGCSAGGTVMPVAYDLLYHHYNTFMKGGRTVNINTMIDSAVYLTPKYFLENSIDNWNPWTVLGNTGFPYDKYKYNTQYSTKLWQHVLKRGSRKDRWGFITHTNDPVSIAYWQAMGGGYYDDDDNDQDGGSWYTDLTTSLDNIESKHRNEDNFYIDGEGHCSFGLYYALQEEGFEEFAGKILKEQHPFRRTASSVPYFVTSLVLGAALLLTASIARLQQPRNIGKVNADTFLPSSSPNSKSEQVVQKISGFFSPVIPYVKRFEKCPITSGYFLATTLYFIFMMIQGGFTHPLDNPSLGPNAATLSTYGINNPTLIVSKKQVLRLLSSTFLCSGVITYLMFTQCIFKCVRHLEATIDNTKVFGFVCLAISIGSNLVYTLSSEGASCGSLPFILGLNVFSIFASKKFGSELELERPSSLTFFSALFALLFFPFNGWVMILTAMVIGAILPCVIESKTSDADLAGQDQQKISFSIKDLLMTAVWSIYTVLYFLIVFGVPSPNEMYQYAHLTGCKTMHSNDINAVAENFGGGRRLGEDNGGDDVCAQFCVPNLIELPFYWGIGKTNYDLDRGLCEDVGYGMHIADKTVSYLRYSLDVGLYYASQYYGDDAN